ncbi:MAG: excinuclease ABC subunit UvrC [Bacteroidales bacterium]
MQKIIIMKEIMNYINVLLRTLPEKSGVYQFYDKFATIIYVGKAKNLQKRVKSYFSKQQTASKTQIMVDKIYDIKYIIVENEYDALLLENNLIKKYQPRYNVLLKDDKTYPWICVKDEAFPRIIQTRKMYNDCSHYFGPYSSVKSMQLILNLIHELFPFRSCNLNLSQDNIDKKKYRVCLDYHIKKCKGPCQGYQRFEDYQKNLLSAIAIIQGNTKLVLKELENEMHAFAQQLEFEKAQEIKEKIDLLKNYQAKSTIVNPKIHDVDVFGIIEDTTSAYVSYFKVMNGCIIQTQNLEIKKRLEETLDEILPLAIVEMRSNSISKTKEIILPFPIKYKIENTKIHIPKQGDKYDLLQLVQRNAVSFMHNIQQKRELAEAGRSSHNILALMQKELHLLKPPAYIECFDNSNIQGKYAVAAMVCFRHAKPSTKEYRHFTIKSLDKADDFASMQEVIQRRYQRLLKENKPLPDLILVDGGKGQVSAAYKTLKALGISHEISLLGIAKRLEEIYRPNDSIPLFIDKKSEVQRVLQHLRDEAHRFGITHHRNKRSKDSFKTALSTIHGIGDQTAKKLLQSFRSVQGVKKATLDELIHVVGKTKAHTVYNYFHIMQ